MVDILQHDYVYRILWSIALLLIIGVIRHSVNQLAYRNIENHHVYHRVRRITFYISTAIYALGLFIIWVENTRSLGTFLGLISAGVAVALKDIIINIVGWIFIVVRRPFRVGDRITINQTKGDVIDIRAFQFSLIEVNPKNGAEQSTGRIVDIPNHYIFIYPVVNSVKGFAYIWQEIMIEITFESDWELAKEKFYEIMNHHASPYINLAEEEVKKASRQYMIHYNNFTPIIYTDVSASGVVLTMRFLCDPRQTRQIKMDIWEDLLRFINRTETVDLAYPTSRVINYGRDVRHDITIK